MRRKAINRAVSLKECYAIRAVAGGDATAEDQKLAFSAIMHKICGTYDWPTAEGNIQETYRRIGMADVGRDIHMLCSVSVSELFPEEVKNKK